MTNQSPIVLLTFATLLIVVLVGLWSLMSAKKSKEKGGKGPGIGGENDPMA